MLSACGASKPSQATAPSSTRPAAANSASPTAASPTIGSSPAASTRIGLIRRFSRHRSASPAKAKVIKGFEMAEILWARSEYAWRPVPPVTKYVTGQALTHLMAATSSLMANDVVQAGTDRLFMTSVTALTSTTATVTTCDDGSKIHRGRTLLPARSTRRTHRRQIKSTSSRLGTWCCCQDAGPCPRSPWRPCRRQRAALSALSAAARARQHDPNKDGRRVGHAVVLASSSSPASRSSGSSLHGLSSRLYPVHTPGVLTTGPDHAPASDSRRENLSPIQVRTPSWSAGVASWNTW